MRIPKRMFCYILLVSILITGCQKEKYVIKTYGGIDKVREFFNYGEQEYREGNYKEAIEQYLIALNTVNGLPGEYADEKASLCYVLGECYAKSDDYKTAISFFEESLLINEKVSGEKELIFSSYTYLSIMYIKIQDENFEKALEYGKKAEIMAQNVFRDDSAKLAKAYKTLGEIYRNMNSFEEANQYWGKAIDFYGEDSKECADIYLEIAQMYEELGEYSEEEEVLKKAIAIFENSNVLGQKGSAHMSLASFYYRRGKHISAIEHNKMALEAYKESGIVGFSVALCHYNMASDYVQLRDWDNFEKEMKMAYKATWDMGEGSEMKEILRTNVKEALTWYYEDYYEGDKTSGFDQWFEEFISM